MKLWAVFLSVSHPGVNPRCFKSDFYPAEAKSPADRLRYYASRFPLAELDSSYHALPFPRNMALWLENTPSGFIFDVKAFSLLTGHPTLPQSIPRTLRAEFEKIPHKKNFYLSGIPAELADKVWQAFALSIKPLADAGKLGVVGFQFPPWFHYYQKNLEYIKYCKLRLPQYRLAVEFRTPDWLAGPAREKTLDFLRENDISLAIVDEPQGLKSSLPPLTEVTASPAIFRFHGRNTANWERKGVTPFQKFNYFYSDEELREWVPHIRQLPV